MNYTFLMVAAKNIAKSFLALDEKDDSLVSQLMFFIPLGAWIIWRIITKYTLLGPSVSSIVSLSTVRWACLAILLAREVLFGRWNRKTFVALVLFAYMAYAADAAGQSIVRDTVILVFFGRNVSFRKIALFCSIVFTALVVLVAACALTGVIDNLSMPVGGRPRYLLGFSHPNNGPGLAFAACVSWVAWRGSKFGWLDALVLLSASCLLFAFANSRTSFALTVLLSVLALLLRWCPEGFLRSKPVMVLLVGSVALCACVSVGLAVAYDPAIGWMKSLNEVLSGRLALGHKAIVKYGLAILPQEANFSDSRKLDLATGTWVAKSNPGIVVDCMYVKLSLSCGIPFLAIAVLLATVVAVRCFKRREWHMLIAILCMALYGISEMKCAYFTNDVLLFLMGGLFYSAAPSRTEPASLSPTKELLISRPANSNTKGG